MHKSGRLILLYLLKMEKATKMVENSFFPSYNIY